MTVLLALALFAPVLVLPLARFAPTAAAARRWSVLGALVLACAWLALLLDDGAAVGRFGAGAAPAAIGTWLLVAAIAWPTQRTPIVTAVTAAAVAVGGVSLLAGQGDSSDAAGAVAIAAAIALLGARGEDDRGLVPAIVCLLGASALSLGVAREGVVVVALGSAVVATAAAGRARRVGSVLLPAALVVGIAAGGGDRVAIALAVAACVLAGRASVALALWAVVAAAAAAPAAGLLLGAAAVLVTVVVNPVVAIVALPGAAALAVSLADRGGGIGLVLAALAAITVARLWRGPDEVRAGVPTSATIGALAAGAWLLLSPQTWAWVGAAELPAWRTAVLVAGGGAVVGAFVVASFTDEPFRVPAVDAPDPEYGPGDPTWAWRAALAALLVLGISGVALVASSMS